MYLAGLFKSMKQRALSLSFGLVVLILLVWAGGEVCAQNTPFQNPSFDSNCFFPQIGVDIDTIYGSHSNEGLGDYIHNLGPKPDGSFGNMLIGNGAVSPLVDWHQAPTGPGFNLHNLKAKAQILSIDPQYIRFGHFRDRTHLDLFDAGLWVIYWADENGDYDSARFTKLSSNVYGNRLPGIGTDGVLSEPYLAHLTTDSVDDIVVGFYTRDSVDSKDSVYLALYKGGSPLFETKRAAYEDTSTLIAPAYPYVHQFSHYSMQGAFHGTARDDLIIADESRNVFLFKNDPPFTLEKLVQAMRYDTLWTTPTRWDSTYKNSYWIDPHKSLAMRAMPKKHGDRSLDWVVWIPTKDSGNCIFIFQGGSDFGSHRITIDSAAFVIASPKTLNEIYWPGEFDDAGDMTGTGNHVFYTLGSSSNSQGYQNFYVTGQALDDKIDLFNVLSAGAFGDTLSAIADTLEDFLMGLPAYTSDEDRSSGKSLVGSQWLMCGSKNIPVRLNPRWAGVELIPQQDGLGLSFSPNPAVFGWSVATIVWPEAEMTEYKVYSILGSIVEHGSIRLLGEAEQQRIYFQNLASGVYQVVIQGRTHEARAKLVIAR